MKDHVYRKLHFKRKEHEARRDYMYMHIYTQCIMRQILATAVIQPYYTIIAR